MGQAKIILLKTQTVSIISQGRPLFALQFGCFIAISFILYLHQFPLALWIGSGAFGLFMSSVFPSTLSMAEHYIDVTGKIIVTNFIASLWDARWPSG